MRQPQPRVIIIAALATLATATPVIAAQSAPDPQRTTTMIAAGKQAATTATPCRPWMPCTSPI